MTIAASRRPLPPVPFNERERLTALFDSCLLDTVADPAFDEITAFAASVMRAPIAVVSLVDQHRQWFKSKIGVDHNETPREDAFCAYAILQRAPLIVADARTDVRFRDNPMVTGDMGVRFYFGIPIRSHDGMPLGALAVVDTVPREAIAPVSSVAFAVMLTLARRVEQLIRAHRTAGYRDRSTGLPNQRRFRENAEALYRSATPATNRWWAVSVEAVSAAQSQRWVASGALNQAARIDGQLRQIAHWIASTTAARGGAYRLSPRHVGLFVEASGAPAVQSMLAVLVRGLAMIAPETFGTEAHRSARAVGQVPPSLRALRLNAFDDEAALVVALLADTAAADSLGAPSAAAPGRHVESTSGGALHWRARHALSTKRWRGVDVSWAHRVNEDDRRSSLLAAGTAANPPDAAASLSAPDLLAVTDEIGSLLERFARDCARFHCPDARIQFDLGDAFLFHPMVLQVMNIAAARGVAPEQIEWALPVAMLRSALAQARRRVQTLRDTGAGIVVTNFGGGFDTLGWLPSLPFTGVRFDARLIDAVGRNSRHGEVARRLSSLVHALGGRVSADSLDTQTALAVARSLAVDEGSGHAIADTIADLIDPPSIFLSSRFSSLP